MCQRRRRRVGIAPRTGNAYFTPLPQNTGKIRVLQRRSNLHRGLLLMQSRIPVIQFFVRLATRGQVQEASWMGYIEEKQGKSAEAL